MFYFFQPIKEEVRNPWSECGKGQDDASSTTSIASMEHGGKRILVDFK